VVRLRTLLLEAVLAAAVTASSSEIKRAAGNKKGRCERPGIFS